MLSDNWGNKFGIKRAKEDITQDLVRMINNSNKFIIFASYSVNLQSNIQLLNALDNKSCIKLAIIPCTVYYSPTKFSVINNKAIIEDLRKHNIGVIIKSKNHSKFLINDVDTYFGSINFTKNSMMYNIECGVLTNIPTIVRRDILEFVIDELKQYNNLITLQEEQNKLIEEIEIINAQYQRMELCWENLSNIPNLCDLEDDLEKYSYEILKLADQIYKLVKLAEYLDIAKMVGEVITRIGGAITIIQSMILTGKVSKKFVRELVNKLEKSKEKMSNFKEYAERSLNEESTEVLETLDSSAELNYKIISQSYKELKDYHHKNYKKHD